METITAGFALLFLFAAIATILVDIQVIRLDKEKLSRVFHILEFVFIGIFLFLMLQASFSSGNRVV